MTTTTGRRRGAQDSEIRAKLLGAAVEILRDEGASGVTARRLADQVGLGRHIVHYYFGTIDEVFVAVMREEGARSERILKEAAETGDALDLLWDNIRQSATVILELTKLAIRHPSISKEYQVYAQHFREAMADILEIYARAKGIELPTSPASSAFLIYSVASTIAVEASMGLTLAHEETEIALLGWLKGLAPGSGR